MNYNYSAQHPSRSKSADETWSLEGSRSLDERIYVNYKPTWNNETDVESSLEDNPIWTDTPPLPPPRRRSRHRQRSLSPRPPPVPHRQRSVSPMHHQVPSRRHRSTSPLRHRGHSQSTYQHRSTSPTHPQSHMFPHQHHFSWSPVAPPILPPRNRSRSPTPPPIPQRRNSYTPIHTPAVPRHSNSNGASEFGKTKISESQPSAPVRQKHMQHRKHSSDSIIDAIYVNDIENIYVNENIYVDVPDASTDYKQDGQSDDLPPTPPPKRPPSTHLKQLIECRARTESMHSRSANLPNPIPPPPPPPPPPPVIMTQRSTEIPLSDVIAQKAKLRKTGPALQKPPRRTKKPTRKPSGRIQQMREKLEREGIMNAYHTLLQREVSSDVEVNAEDPKKTPNTASTLPPKFTYIPHIKPLMVKPKIVEHNDEDTDDELDSLPDEDESYFSSARSHERQRSASSQEEEDEIDEESEETQTEAISSEESLQVHMTPGKIV